MRKLNFDNQNCYCRVLLSVVDSKNRHKIEPYFDNFYDNLVIFTESATARFGTRKLIFTILKIEHNSPLLSLSPLAHIFNTTGTP